MEYPTPSDQDVRDRRKFTILVSIILFVSIFGWSIPESVTILGNDFDASPISVQVFALILMLYWGSQYFLFFNEFRDAFREGRRQILVAEYLQNDKRIWRQIDESRQTEMASKEPPYLPHEIHLLWIQLHDDVKPRTLELKGNVIFKHPDSDNTADHQQDFHIQWRATRLLRARIWILHSFSSKDRFRMYAPIVIACCALLAWGARIATPFQSAPLNFFR